MSSIQSHSFVRSFGAYAGILAEAWHDLRCGRVSWREVSRQVVVIGLQSLPIVIITSIFTGMVLALQTAYGLQRFGAKNYVGNIVGLAIVRELGPVLTAVMLCGRVGAGIAAEIASMVATEQVDAMKALGASPTAKLVAPRLMAALLVLPLLAVFANVIGIYGGMIIAVHELGLTGHNFYRGLMDTVVIRDFLDGLIKSAIFGFLLVSISCYKGLTTTGGTEGVGRSTTSAVVTSSIVIFVADFFITKLLIVLHF
ncbi:MAG: ABC transporter permease [Deltaproteobacteria bacterium]|nr:ABC transporter permease [Deltaproteobacteria bacterium]